MVFSYGTAGFRMDAALMDPVMDAVGSLAVLRSCCLKSAIGVMITASHNPPKDNGVKLVDPLGDMLDSKWEQYAMDLANNLISVQQIIDLLLIDMGHATVIVGRDSRPSGLHLNSILVNAIHNLHGHVVDFGLLSTPQLHYLVRCYNTKDSPLSYGLPTLDGYYSKLANAFNRIINGKPPLDSLLVDCANGIGGQCLHNLIKFIDPRLKFAILNNDTSNSEKLNADCGADFVKINQKEPFDLQVGARACSLDGDADRIVFYYKDSTGFKLLDGDKIATLAASYILHLLRTSNARKDNGSQLTIGVIQTAYANGSSTKYIRETLQIPVVFTQTGVKHLHHEAQKFDIGVYFEANGHGTVLFSQDAIDTFQNTSNKSGAEKQALETLLDFSELINQTVGDALSDMLMVEAILISSGSNFARWNASYTDLYNRQEKVKVKNRTKFVPINADTELLEPAGMQQKIVQIVEKYNGRSFVRPSGTEDVVRVYAEAATPEATRQLADEIVALVREYE